MKTILTMLLICSVLSSCRRTTVASNAELATRDLSTQLQENKATLAGILPEDMSISRAEVSKLPKGKGILFHAFPKDGEKAHPSFALFLWPSGNPTDIAYETGEGAHTFVRIGSSDEFRVYYSGPSGLLKHEVQQAFCTHEKK